MFESIVNRTRAPGVWQKIPWDDPAFSARMLREHLSQAHDAASRRFEIIDAHVAWLHDAVLGGAPARILDLGCGPGFYADRLEALGHTCVGVDISPASVGYARANHRGTFRLGDAREIDDEAAFDVAMMVYGELNAFSPEDARRVVANAHRALRPGGTLVLEASTYDSIAAVGAEPAGWYSAQSGLFGDEPHLCLSESWFEDDRSVNRYFVIDAATGALTTYLSMHHAYTEDAYRALLAGFKQVTVHPSLDGGAGDGSMLVWVAQKA